MFSIFVGFIKKTTASKVLKMQNAKWLFYVDVKKNSILACDFKFYA